MCKVNDVKLARKNAFSVANRICSHFHAQLGLVCMLRLGFFNIKDPQQIFLTYHACSRRKNKFVSAVILEELTFDDFDRTKVTYTFKLFSAPDDVTKCVSSNGVHLRIKNVKLFDVKMV